jgi:class 3 adenylate cyclase
VTADETARIDGIAGNTTSVLRTLVLSDLVDSTALVERLGDQRAADLIRKHDRLARALMQQHGGREIDKTDGFLLVFERPIQAVAYALDWPSPTHSTISAGSANSARRRRPNLPRASASTSVTSSSGTTAPTTSAAAPSRPRSKASSSRSRRASWVSPCRARS